MASSLIWSMVLSALLNSNSEFTASLTCMNKNYRILNDSSSIRIIDLRVPFQTEDLVHVNVEHLLLIVLAPLERIICSQNIWKEHRNIWRSIEQLVLWPPAWSCQSRGWPRQSARPAAPTSSGWSPRPRWGSAGGWSRTCRYVDIVDIVDI